MEIIEMVCILLSSKSSIFRAMGHATIQGETTMCLALYLAAAQELPVISWEDANPAFHVIHLPHRAEGVRKHFRSNYIYYAGSEQGCSCAFNYEHEYDSILELRKYLRNALICVTEVEMFSCQIGAEEQDTQHTLITSPDGIALAEFFFKDGHYLVISPGKDSQRVTEAEKCLQRVTGISSGFRTAAALVSSSRHTQVLSRSAQG
jgi:hypothetical protein